MDKQTLRQIKIDSKRIVIASERIDNLVDAYESAMVDLAIARSGLKIIATWASANCFRFDHAEHDIGHIHDRAMDTLSLINNK